METLVEPTLSFEPTENQMLVMDLVQAFGEKHIRPNIMAWDEQQTFPIELFREMGQVGLMGMLVPQEYGGAGFGYLEYVTAVSEIARFDGSIGLSLAAHNSLCTNHILEFGSADQKSQYLPRLAKGELIGAWALTEPNTGSDALRMKSTAVRQDDHWVLNGSKCWITHGKSGEVVVALMRTGEALDTHGITAFIVEQGAPGMRPGRKENKLGMRASETTEIIFENCQVPAESVIGEIGEGFIQAMKVLDGGRISIAALGLGIAKGAYEAALRYSKERHQFGQAIAEFQGIAFKLADMATKIEAGELLCMRAADAKNRGEAVTRLSAEAKYYCAEIAVQISTDAVQVFGGYGYTKDFPVEKYYRDSKLCTIGEGTSEIQKVVIAKELGKGR
jgi:alkylation response protein AidB-like acyl-CoA dehydrogenase